MGFSASLWIHIGLIAFVLVWRTNAQCTWPSAFDSTTWLDSQQEQIDFTSDTHLSGFSVQLYGTTLNEYICQEESFDTDKIILIRSTATADLLGGNWYSYICLKFTELTAEVSYTYYRLNVQQPDAGEQRTKPILDDAPAGTIATVCNETHGASGAEFVTIIKQGSEASAYITCPSVLLGRFDFAYTNSAGTGSCNDTKHHMNVCTDKTQLAFDDPCSGQSIVYASDSVYCVATVSAGSDTYIQLYNPGAVDSSNTYRFSCMAMSSDSLSATIVYNNCTNHQTSSYVPRSHDGTTIGASISFKPYVFCQGGCTWPTAFESSVWRDNTRGDITFGTDTLTGWSITVQGTVVDQWECLDNSYFDAEGILIIKSTITFSSMGGSWTTFICLEMTKVTEESYYYYQKHDQIDNGGYERGKFDPDGTITGKANICGTITVPAAEFHFMVKSGSESASKQYCSPSLLAKMDYTHTDDAGTETCQSTTDEWDVCTDRTIMTFDYTSPACSTEMAYSSTGQVYCMVNLTSTYEYTVVYNADASPTYRFACIVSNSGGTAASVVYNNCTIGQTPTAYAKMRDGTDIGYLATMTATETCPFLGPTTQSSAVTVATGAAASSPSDGGSIIPIIVGAVVGALVLLILIAIIIYCLKFKKRSDVTHNDEKEKLPEDSRNGHIDRIHVEEVDTNPVLTVDPARNTLTPLPPKPDVYVPPSRVLPPINNHM